ncbi:uncharacterized protein L201_004185 [Kwoniella dendrophila CBS 6074]|uniref:Myb-like domain-containing protein n=1 Tax=Kwoniella dendrophila CBS 6074 TaxID=1295534 RepID=A0AAX4JVD4_9TREE
MSLRLPSQNKFRPTFKPGQKKAPPVRPPSNTLTSSQNAIATASSSSQPSAISNNKASSFSAPHASQKPGHSIQQTSNSHSPTAAKVVPKPIPSSQIKAIRSTNSPTKAPLTPSQSNPEIPSSTAAQDNATETSSKLTSIAETVPTVTSLSSPTVPVEPQSTVPASPKVSTAPPPPPSPAPAPGPKLSLLAAARNHSSDMPSPGQIRRRTPSIASRSERAPSITPQPHRAPSAAPQIRAPSVTPSFRRGSSVTPQQSASANAHPPSSVAVPVPSPQISQPVLPPSLASTTPSVPAPSSNPVPPRSLGTSTPAPGFPPSLGTFSTIPPADHTSPTSRDDTAALAAAAVSSIGGLPQREPTGLPRPVRKGKRRITKGAAPRAESSAPEENGNPPAKKPAKRVARRPIVRANTEDRPTSEDEEDSSSEGTIDVESGEKRKSTKSPREERRSRKRQKKAQLPKVAMISLQDIEPEELIGERVDEVLMTMGDLATTLVAQGRVSTRAIKIDVHKRAEAEKKRAEKQAQREQTWKRNQIKRRKVRHTKNLDRAKRREELAKLGQADADVSQDEDDSEEEFEPQPERLTPESTPEPDIRREGSSRPNQDYDGLDGDEWNNNDDDEYNDVPVNNNPMDPLLMDDDHSQLGDEMEPDQNQDDDGGILTAEAIALQAQKDEDDAALAAMGIRLVDGPMDEGNGGEDDEEDYEEPDWNLDNDDYPDIEGYRREQERERRRIREYQDNDNAEVVEIDDETRFINANSFSKYTKPQRWNAVETELFYQVLEETGENYTLMKAYFPGRTIKQLKLKGLKENRINPDKMTAAILARKPLDMEYLSKSAGYDSTRSWDKEEALFEEAKNDADRLRRIDSVRPEDEDGENQNGPVDEHVGGGEDQYDDQDNTILQDEDIDLEQQYIDQEENGDETIMEDGY